VAKSFRLDPDLGARLDQAARAEGVATSSFIREAIRERCNRVLDRSLADELADVIGTVDSTVPRSHGLRVAESGSLAERSGEAFKELLLSRRRQ
jgi:predicted DNA-binding protein